MNGYMKCACHEHGNIKSDKIGKTFNGIKREVSTVVRVSLDGMSAWSNTNRW